MKLSEIKIPFFTDEKVIDPEYHETFQFHGLKMGRLIGSKTGYLSTHPNELIVFNANIITKKGGKIWFGDLNVTKSLSVLKEIANKFQEDLYILREHDARFENENLKFKEHKKRSVFKVKYK